MSDSCTTSRRFDPPSKLALHPQFAAYMAGEKVYPINLEISCSGVCQATCPFVSTPTPGNSARTETSCSTLLAPSCS